MKNLEFEIVKLNEKAVVPEKLNGNLGFDLSVVADDDFYDHFVENEPRSKRFMLGVGSKKIFKTGLKIAIPAGYGVLFRDRSGLSALHSIHVMAGVIDSTYRGEWKVALINLGNRPYQFVEGDRIIQAVIVPEFNLKFNEVDELDKTLRGETGFGASGR